MNDDEYYEDDDYYEEGDMQAYLKHYDETDWRKDIGRGNGRIKHGLTYDEGVKELIRLASSMSGTNFALLMEKEDGTFSSYSRENQPCQGGEMRKYKETHGDECTRPTDERPTDLRDPFPEGKPVAVSIHLYNPGHRPFLEAVFSEGPYHRAVKKYSFVELKQSKKIVGIVFEGMAVDPTAFVNMLQFIRTCGGQEGYYDTLIANGLTIPEALCTMMLHSAMPRAGVSTVNATYNYYFPVHASIRRIIDGDFFDLSGGTFEDRYDYNRPDVQDLFKAREGETKTIFQKEMNEFHGLIVEKPNQYDNRITMKIISSIEAFCEAAKTIIRRDYEIEINRLTAKEEIAA